MSIRMKNGHKLPPQLSLFLECYGNNCTCMLIHRANALRVWGMLMDTIFNFSLAQKQLCDRNLSSNEIGMQKSIERAKEMCTCVSQLTFSICNLHHWFGTMCLYAIRTKLFCNGLSIYMEKSVEAKNISFQLIRPTLSFCLFQAWHVYVFFYLFLQLSTSCGMITKEEKKTVPVQYAMCSTLIFSPLVASLFSFAVFTCLFSYSLNYDSSTSLCLYPLHNADPLKNF